MSPKLLIGASDQGITEVRLRPNRSPRIKIPTYRQNIGASGTGILAFQ